MDRQPRLATLLLIGTLPLVVAWYVAGNSDERPRQTGATASAAPRSPTPLAARRSAEPVRPRRAVDRRLARPTEAARRRALIHPLVGMRSVRLIRRLGPPTTRSSEAGLTLFEYHLPEADYQLVLVERRVVEVNRIR